MIRRALLADSDAMLELCACMHAEGAFAGLPFDRAKVAALIKRCILTQDYIALVAERDGQIVGGLLARVTQYFFCNELLATDYGVYMRPDCRGGTLGARMIKGYIDWARSKGAREVSIGISVDIHRDRVGKLLERLGFSCRGGSYKMEIP